RVLTGELTPDTGAVLLDGQDLVRLSPAALAGRRAVLPQATRLSFPFTVHEVIRLGLSGGSRRSGGHRAGQDGARVAALLRRVDLAGFGDRYYQQLSGGEQQRVHLARVLAQLDAPSPGGAARALFLDEPISSLDIRHQLAVLRIARDVADNSGAVVAILHDLNLAAMFADRLLAVDG
ncbi:MAG: ATP-binding cassette domain-containing protein, partial [Hydrogenophaga sp.]